MPRRLPRKSRGCSGKNSEPTANKPRKKNLWKRRSTIRNLSGSLKFPKGESVKKMWLLANWTLRKETSKGLAAGGSKSIGKEAGASGACRGEKRDRGPPRLPVPLETNRPIPGERRMKEPLEKSISESFPGMNTSPDELGGEGMECSAREVRSLKKRFFQRQLQKEGSPGDGYEHEKYCNSAKRRVCWEGPRDLKRRTASVKLGNA